jgi:hypothetical protein
MSLFIPEFKKMIEEQRYSTKEVFNVVYIVMHVMGVKKG